MFRGYVKVYRKLLDSGIVQSGPASQLFLWAMLTATHQPRKAVVSGSIVALNEGQAIFTRRLVSDRLGLSERSVRTALQLLEKLDFLTSEMTNKYTVITIVNWATYQSDGPQGDPQNDQQTTHARPANDPRPTHKQEVKNEKNVNTGTANPKTSAVKPPPPPDEEFESFWKAYPNRDGKKDAVKAWARARNKTSLEAILDAIAIQKQSHQWREPQFIPRAATWLNGERWGDKLAPRRDAGKPSLFAPENADYTASMGMNVLGCDEEED